jgi:hypothetical protein
MRDSAVWASLLLGAVIFGAPSMAVADSPAVQRFVYRDHEDGRVLGAVELGAEVGADGASLEVTLTATGPDVEAPPGFRYLRGVNLLTAAQFGAIVDGRVPLTLVTRDSGGREVVSAPARVMVAARIPVRAMRADGRIDYLATTAREFPLALRTQTATMADGEYQTILQVGHVARWQMTYRVERGAVRITRYDSVAGEFGHALATDGPPVLGVDAAGAAVVPIAKPTDWVKRDIEGKWALLQKSVAENNQDARPRWIAFLLAEKEYELLEWVCDYDLEGVINDKLLESLRDANAPVWVRQAFWMLDNRLDHNSMEASMTLMAKQELLVAWMAANPEAKKEMGDIPFLVEAQKVAPDMAGAKGQLPALKAAEVLRHLDAPAALADFGERTSAERGVVYRQQVIRGLRGIVASGRVGEPWMEKVHVLTRHGDVAVRREAFLVYTHVPLQVPMKEFLAVAEDAKETASMRELALLVYSYAPHPLVYFKLLNVAATTGHPGWLPAVSRLGEIGDSYALHMLKSAERSPGEKSPVQKRAVEMLQKRLGEGGTDELRHLLMDPKPAAEKHDESVELAMRLLQQALERQVWAEQSRDVLGAGYAAWVGKSIDRADGEKMRSLLKVTAETYESNLADEKDRKVTTTEVRALAVATLARLSRK